MIVFAHLGSAARAVKHQQAYIYMTPYDIILITYVLGGAVDIS